ncbi:MAG: alpha-L-fucosidase [Lentisphaerae bacterium]|nr:alpha-L-fucosidase [Lentisphaerota bacterium]
MTYEEKLKWFNEARFGIYVHFGLYSLLGRGEWVMYSERIPAKEYAKLADSFYPKSGCAKEWVEIAKAAGAKYMVLTTRHHDGFCLFDSKYSDFTSVNHGCKRDIIREYVEAAREAGMKVGFYYSLLDWRFPGYFEPEKYPESKDALLKQVFGQVRELMTNYGQIDVLEYDGGWDSSGLKPRSECAEFWHAAELNTMVRELQPQIIINDRSGKDEDIETPEQVVIGGKERMTESCMCIGDSCGWGYVRFNPNWKSAEQLLQHLVQAAQLGGNYLLNIGPCPDGSVRNEEIERLLQVGKWLGENEEAIRNSSSCDLIGAAQPGFLDLNLHGPWTRKGNVGYWCIFRWPGSVATAIRIAAPVKKVTMLVTGKEYPFTWDEKNGKLVISGLPALPPDPLATVLKVEFDGIPRRMAEDDLAAWIDYKHHQQL